MGAYLTHPKTDKYSIEDANEYMVVAASSMQGWRNSQEDAHNAILKYDENTSFFAVYDGHGGAEVATYCADHLPNFLKSLESYKNGDIESALKQAFLDFDKTLLEPEVVSILKELAGETLKETAELSCEEDDEDLAELHEESSLSLKKVLKRYGACGVRLTTTDDNDDEDDDDENVDAAAAAGLSMPSLKLLKEGGQKPQSPYLRGRRAAAVVADAVNKAVLNPDAHPAGSSTSSAAAAAAASRNDAGPSTSSVSKMETEEDSTVSSTNTVANNLSNNVKLHNHATTAAVSSLNDTEAEAEAVSKQKPIAATNGEIETPDSSHIVKENEQNGSVTSSEAAGSKQKQQVSTSTVQESNHNDAIVSGSSDVTKKQQNGNSATSSSAASTSATADLKKNKMSDDDSTDDDADYDADNDEDEEQQNAMNYSSDEDDDEDEDDEFEEDDDEEEEDEEEVDERHYVRDLDEEKANEEFCANMAEEAGQDSGCTAVVAVLHGRDLYVANAGDSRCIVCRNGKAIEMSLDHKPEDKEESARIYKAGGRVTVDGRVNGGLNLSRAIGDHAYKMNASLPAEEQMISALPDIKKLVITPEDEFMVLACDGIWNFMSNEEVVEFVRTRLVKIEENNKEISEICEELFDNCLAPNTLGDGTGCDNMTAVIVRFKPKLQQLATKINPEECEDALMAKAAELTSKRTASSSLDDDEPQQNKRLKTDSEEDKSCLETSSAITSSTTSNQRSNSAQLTDVAPNAAATASSSSTSSALISTSEASTSSKSQTNDANECDSVIPDSSEAAAATS